MRDKLKKIVGKVKDTVSSTATLLGDLNGDGKVDEEDARIAAKWVKEKANIVAEEAEKLGKKAVRSDMVKDAAAGAAVGAVVAVPIPVIGPVAGAAIGAGLGVYKNLTKREQVVVMASKDIQAELLKLDDLRQKKIITEAEFEKQKRTILDEHI